MIKNYLLLKETFCFNPTETALFHVLKNMLVMSFSVCEKPYPCVALITYSQLAAHHTIQKLPANFSVCWVTKIRIILPTKNIVFFRCVFAILSNIYELLVNNYFRKKVPSYMFHRVLNTTLFLDRLSFDLILNNPLFSFYSLN